MLNFFPMHLSLRITAAITAFLFIVTGLSPVSFAVPSIQTAVQAESSVADFNLDLPAELGTIENLQSGTGPAVIQIQTAHGNYDAQKKIQSILQFLNQKYGIRHLLLEGSPFEIHPEYLQFIPGNPAASREIADRLTKEALIQGPELFLMENPEARAYGIETLETYVENGKAFADVLRQQEKTRGFLGEMDMQIERLTSPYMNKELRSFVKRLDDFETKRLSFPDWLNYLKEQAEKTAGLELSNAAFQIDWPMLVRLFVLVDIEKKLNVGKLESEKTEFLKAIKQLPESVRSAVENLLSTQVSRNQLPEPGTRVLFEKMSELLPFGFDYSKFPNVKLLIGHLILQSELKGDILMAEEARLSGIIAETLANHDGEKKILALLGDYRLLKKLFALELAPADYEKLLARGNRVRPSAIANRFLEINEGKRVKDIKFNHLAEIDSLFDKALEFYRLVKKRDALMTANTAAKIKELGAEKVVVVTGGFHSGPFQNYFTNNGFAYALISPRITNPEDGGREAYVRAALESMNSYGNQTYALADPYVQDGAENGRIFGEPRFAANRLNAMTADVLAISEEAAAGQLASSPWMKANFADARSEVRAIDRRAFLGAAAGAAALLGLGSQPESIGQEPKTQTLDELSSEVSKGLTRGLTRFRNPRGILFNQADGGEKDPFKFAWIKSGDIGFSLTALMMDHMEAKTAAERNAALKNIRAVLQTHEELVADYGLKINPVGLAGYGPKFKGQQTGILPEFLGQDKNHPTKRDYFRAEPENEKNKDGLVYASFDMALTHERMIYLRQFLKDEQTKNKNPDIAASIAVLDRLTDNISYRPFIGENGKLHQVLRVDAKMNQKPRLEKDLYVDNKHTEAVAFLPLIDKGYLGAKGEEIWDAMSFNWKAVPSGTKDTVAIAVGDGELTAWAAQYASLFYPVHELAPATLGVDADNYMAAALYAAKTAGHEFAGSAPGTSKSGKYIPLGIGNVKDPDYAAVPYGIFMLTASGNAKAKENARKFLQKVKEASKGFDPQWGLFDSYDPVTGKANNRKVISMNQVLVREARAAKELRAIAKAAPTYAFVERKLKQIDKDHPVPAALKPVEAKEFLSGLIEKNMTGKYLEGSEAKIEPKEKKVTVAYKVDEKNKESGVWFKLPGVKIEEGHRFLEITWEGKQMPAARIEFKDGKNSVIGKAAIAAEQSKSGTFRVDITEIAAVAKDRPVEEMLMIFDKAGEGTFIITGLKFVSRSELRAEVTAFIVKWSDLEEKFRSRDIEKITTTLARAEEWKVGLKALYGVLKIDAEKAVDDKDEVLRVIAGFAQLRAHEIKVSEALMAASEFGRSKTLNEFVRQTQALLIALNRVQLDWTAVSRMFSSPLYVEKYLNDPDDFMEEIRRLVKMAALGRSEMVVERTVMREELLEEDLTLPFELTLPTTDVVKRPEPVSERGGARVLTGGPSPVTGDEDGIPGGENVNPSTAIPILPGYASSKGVASETSFPEQPLDTQSAARGFSLVVKTVKLEEIAGEKDKSPYYPGTRFFNAPLDKVSADALKASPLAPEAFRNERPDSKPAPDAGPLSLVLSGRPSQPLKVEGIVSDRRYVPVNNSGFLPQTVASLLNREPARPVPAITSGPIPFPSNGSAEVRLTLSRSESRAELPTGFQSLSLPDLIRRAETNSLPFREIAELEIRKDARSIPALINLFIASSNSPALQQRILPVIVSFGAQSFQQVFKLLKSTKEPERLIPLIRLTASFGVTAAPAVTFLVNTLFDKTAGTNVRVEAANALELLLASGIEKRAVFKKANVLLSISLEQKNSGELRIAVLRLLQQLRNEINIILPLLLVLATRDESDLFTFFDGTPRTVPGVARLVIAEIGRNTPIGEGVVSQILPFIKNAKPDSGTPALGAAVEIAAGIGPAAETLVLPLLLVIQNDSFPLQVRIQAAGALPQILRPYDPVEDVAILGQVIPEMNKIIADKKIPDEVRVPVIESAGIVGPAAEPLIESLRAAQAETSAAVVRAAVESILFIEARSELRLAAVQTLGLSAFNPNINPFASVPAAVQQRLDSGVLPEQQPEPPVSIPPAAGGLTQSQRFVAEEFTFLLLPLRKYLLIYAISGASAVAALVAELTGRGVYDDSFLKERKKTLDAAAPRGSRFQLPDDFAKRVTGTGNVVNQAGANAGRVAVDSRILSDMAAQNPRVFAELVKAFLQIQPEGQPAMATVLPEGKIETQFFKELEAAIQNSGIVSEKERAELSAKVRSLIQIIPVEAGKKPDQVLVAFSNTSRGIAYVGFEEMAEMEEALQLVIGEGVAFRDSRQAYTIVIAIVLMKPAADLLIGVKDPAQRHDVLRKYMASQLSLTARGGTNAFYATGDKLGKMLKTFLTSRLVAVMA